MEQDYAAIAVGDTVELKKTHPCGGRMFEVLYAGMDVRLKCLTCGSQIRLPRKKFHKMLRGLEIHR